MKSIAKCAVALLVAALAVSTVQASMIVNVDITTHTTPAYSSTGAIGTGTFWNTGTTGSNLKAEDGTTVTTIGHALTGSYSAGGVGATIALFSDYVNCGPATLTITGLDNAMKYNLILYGAQNFMGGRGATFTVNSVALNTSGDQQSSFAEGVNYVRYDNLAPASNSLVATISTGPESVGIFNGFQLQVIPEPASLGLLGVAGLAMLWRRRLKG